MMHKIKTGLLIALTALFVTAACSDREAMGVVIPTAELARVATPTVAPVVEAAPEEKEIVHESWWGRLFEIPAALEEMIVKSAVVARVRLRGVEAAAVRRSEVYTGRPSSEYNGALALTLDVLEYLKGDTASTTITAYAYGFDTLMDEYTAPTQEEAIVLGQRLLTLRDTRWDDREAVVFLRYNAAEQHYFLGLVRADERWVWDFTVASIMWKAWLPEDAAAAGAGEGTRSPQAQRFLLDDPDNYPGGGGAAARSSDGPVPPSDAPTATLASLRDTVTGLVRELAAGDGTQAYRDCVVTKYEMHSQSLIAAGPFPPFEVEMTSGMPTGTRLAETPATRELELGSSAGEIFFTEGPDSDVLVGAWPDVINAARPLPAGRYRAWLRVLTAGEQLCNDVTPEVWRRAYTLDLTVTASAITTREAFFDPYADGAAVTGTTTVGTISWQSGEAGSGQAGRVTADLDIDVTGHALDFIGLDGTTTLSLIVADATETGGTLTWTAPTQPWSAGDKLMLRVRRHEAPTPTATPTPIPTDRPVILFLDSLDSSVLDSLEMAVGEVFWVSIQALNLARSASYTIELTRVNDEPAGGVGIVFHYQACGYTPQSIRRVVWEHVVCQDDGGQAVHGDWWDCDGSAETGGYDVGHRRPGGIHASVDVCGRSPGVPFEQGCRPWVDVPSIRTRPWHV